MSVKIKDSQEAGGGHRSYDLEIDVPKGGIKQSDTYKRGVELEKEVFGKEIIESSKKAG